MQQWTKMNRHNNKEYIAAGNYMLRVNNRDTRTTCEICSKLRIKTPLNIFHTLLNCFYC